MSCGSTPARRVMVGPREALRAHRINLSDVNWLGDGRSIEALAGREVFVKVRSTRAPRAAWLSGETVELIDAEEGVAPGQACAFYDGADGQARVLGGGIIAGVVEAPIALRGTAGQRAFEGAGLIAKAAGTRN